MPPKKTPKPKAPPKKASKLSGTEEVAAFMDKLDHPLKKEIETIREIILSANKKITEHIKWKAPSFCFNGEDRVTFNIRNECILLVFHRGAKVKETKEDGPILKDTTGLLEWASNDRALVKFYNSKEVNAKKDQIEKVVSQWIKLTSE
jgi:uncharacterized protein YdeI (YjbR/CyaY-like superfamily)